MRFGTIHELFVRPFDLQTESPTPTTCVVPIFRQRASASQTIDEAPVHRFDVRHRLEAEPLDGIVGIQQRFSKESCTVDRMTNPLTSKEIGGTSGISYGQ